MIESVSDAAGAIPGLKKMRRRSAPGADSGLDRLPPHAPEAEAGVLGCLLLAPAPVLDELDERKFQADFFYDLRHQLIFAAARAMHCQTPPLAVDVITLQAELKQRGELEQVGGLAYLVGLPDTVPSAANLSHYADIVEEKWQLRLLVRTCTETVGAVYAHEGEVAPLLAGVQKAFLQIENAVMPAMESTFKTLAGEQAIPELEAHYNRGKAQIKGVTTGLETLDKYLCGMGRRRGFYYVFAARPGVGKTSLATQIAMHAACDYQRWEEIGAEEFKRLDETKGLPVTTAADGRHLALKTGIPVGISSLEMDGATLVEKMLFARSGADLQRWRTGFAEQGDLLRLTTAAKQLGGSPHAIVIDDTSRLKIGQLKAKWRRWHRQYGVRLFILDYLQLMQADERRFRPDRVQELAEVSAELQALGKELKCPMIVLAQMNRDYEKDPSRAPRLSDLKDCGAVEQDADVVAFLYEPRLADTAKRWFDSAMEQAFGENWKKWDGRPQRINILIGKNRLGPKGRAELLLLHSSTTFVDWNVWQKEKKIKAPAKGEEFRYADESGGDDED